VRHGDPIRWIDFVRGLASQPEQAILEAHLQSGCPDCSRTHQLLRGVLAITAREWCYQVPEEVIERAQAIFRARKLQLAQDLSLTVPALALGVGVWGSFGCRFDLAS
jgi:hypothetical protein